MTVDDRFDRIERDLAAIVEAQRIQTETISQLIQTVGAFVDSADTRMKRTEENLDALIRAITAEHSNGKGSAH